MTRYEFFLVMAECAFITWCLVGIAALSSEDDE